MCKWTNCLTLEWRYNRFNEVSQAKAGGHTVINTGNSVLADDIHIGVSLLCPFAHMERDQNDISQNFKRTWPTVSYIHTV